MKKNTVIFIHGLAGVGKTTISSILSPLFKAKVFRIGAYRKKELTEDESWVNLFNDVFTNASHNKFTIIETTGMNRREFYLLPLNKKFNIKKFYLDAPLKTLEKRIDQKKITERGGWLTNLFHHFPFKEYKNKKDFNKKLFKDYKKLLKTTKHSVIDNTKDLMDNILFIIKKVYK